MTGTHLPEELAEAIEAVVTSGDYAVYVLDGQDSQRTGDQDDWHDALVLIEPDQVGNDSPDRLIKFTMEPEGHISYYRPLTDEHETVVQLPSKES